MQPENWSNRENGLFADGVTASGIEEAVKNAIDMCYGTDDRHGLIAVAVADLLVYNKPIPWRLKDHFGAPKPSAQEVFDRRRKLNLARKATLEFGDKLQNLEREDR